MTKALKGFLCGLVLIAAIAAPACRHKTTPVKPTVQPTETVSMTVPPVPTTTTVAPPVITNTDFVQTETQPRVTSEELSPNIEEANRQAQLRGFIKDAYFGYDEAALSADAQSALTDSANWLKRYQRPSSCRRAPCPPPARLGIASDGALASGRTEGERCRAER